MKKNELREVENPQIKTEYQPGEGKTSKKIIVFAYVVAILLLLMGILTIFV